jgi:hypothetical protein
MGGADMGAGRMRMQWWAQMCVFDGCTIHKIQNQEKNIAPAGQNCKGARGASPSGTWMSLPMIAISTMSQRRIRGTGG